MCSLKSPGYEAVEVPCGTTSGTKFLLPVDQILDQAKKILAIEAYSPTNVAIGPVTGAALQVANVFNSSFLVLVGKNNDQPISQIPLQDLNRFANNGVLFEVDVKDIVIEKSYILCLGQSSNLDTAKVWLLGFHYQK